jgi:hypothetical protein
MAVSFAAVGRGLLEDLLFSLLSENQAGTPARITLACHLYSARA